MKKKNNNIVINPTKNYVIKKMKKNQKIKQIIII